MCMRVYTCICIYVYIYIYIYIYACMHVPIYAHIHGVQSVHYPVGLSRFVKKSKFSHERKNNFLSCRDMPM